MITSSDNPRVKYIKSLALKKNREKEKKFVIEGAHLIAEALAASKEEKEFKIEYCKFFYTTTIPLYDTIINNPFNSIRHFLN